MRQSRFTTVLLVLAFLLCGVGAGISGVLMQHHIVAQIGGDPLLGAACRATEALSCDQVIASKWGKLELAWGKDNQYKLVIPTAAFGLFFFASLGSWFLAVGVPTGKRRWLHWLPTLAATAGLAGCAWFEYIMFVKIGKYCPLCMATHAATLLIFVLTLLMWIRRRVAMPPVIVGLPPDRGALLGLPPLIDSPSGRMVLTALLLAISTSGLGWTMYAYRLKSGYAEQYFHRWQDYDKDTRFQYDRFLKEPTVDIPIGPDDPVLGPADAKFTVVLFSDLMCPYCKTLAAELEKRREEFPGQFRIVFKHFPLETKCNAAVPSTLHPGACSAAVATEALRMLKGNDAFWKLHDAFFHDQEKLTQGKIKLTEFVFQQAEAMGIDREAFTKRVQTYAVWARIHRNTAEAKQLGINSTPVMYFNNRKLAPWGDRHTWQYLLSDETLAAVSQPASAPASQQASRPASRSASRPARAASSQPASRP